MNIHPIDIIHKKGDIYINESLLIRELGLNRDYLRTHGRYKARKNSNRAWQYKYMHGKWYYLYETIGNKAPHFYKSQLPTWEELIQMAKTGRSIKRQDEGNGRIITNIVSDKESNQDTLYYMYQSKINFPQKLATELCRSLAWMRFLAEYYDNGKHTNLGFNKKADFLHTCANIIKEEDLEGLKTTKLETLWKKLYYFPRNNEIEQKNYLISGKYGNDNAKIVGKFQIVHPETGEIMRFDAHEALMYELWMNPYKGNKRSKYDLYHNDYTQTITEYEIDPVDYRTFCSYINRFSNRALMSLERDGKKHFNDSYMPYVAAHQVQYSLSLIAGDGSGSKLAYSYVDKDGKLKRATLYIVRISDVASRKIIGYSIGTHETPELVRQAIKMAIKNAGNREFMEFVSDNGPSFSLSETKQLLSMVCRKSRKINAYNSQENPAEMHVRLLTEFSRKFDNWLYTGFNAHHIDFNANPDYFPENDELLTYEQAVTQIVNLIHEYNNTEWNGKSPAARFEDNMNPKANILEDKVLRYCFGEKTEVNLAYMRGFVNVYKKNGEDNKAMKYIIPDYHLNIDLIGKETGYQEDASVMVCYNEDCADLYTIAGKFILSCPRAELASKTEAEATEDTNKALGKLKQRKESFTESAESFRDDVVESADVFKYGTFIKDSSLKGKVKDKYNQDTENELSKKLDNTSTSLSDRKRPKEKRPKQIKQSVEKSALDQM